MNLPGTGGNSAPGVGGDPAAEWRRELAGWAIPARILAAAPEPPYALRPAAFRPDPVPPDTPSRRLALARLPAGGTVIDVGCGAGAAGLALAPPAALVVGVDADPDMLARFAVEADSRGVGHRQVLGRWPEVAPAVGTGDVVVSAHVLYNVPDLPGFATALTAAARRRVVVEVTERHPWADSAPLWRHFHDLERPAGPDAALAAAVLRGAGLPVQSRRWLRPPPRTDRDEVVRAARRRLCLPATSDPDVDAALPAHAGRLAREVVTLWWDR